MSKHITGHTGLLCLLGSPVAHSVSPEMHNEACDQLGLDYSYLAFDVPEDKMPQAVEGLRTMGARGWNITMPGKNIMCRLADKVSPASEISGACNTIVNDNGVLTAYTTDGVGFMRAVAENGVDIIGKKMTLLGADQDHLHSLEIDALFGQCLPVSHTIGIVAFQFSGYLTVFVAEVDYGIDSAA